MWYLSIILFLFFTILYFVFYDQLGWTTGYFIFMVVIQYAVALGLTVCPFNTQNNLYILAYTIGPWFFIFGVMLISISYISPDLIYLFANVYGYLYVSSAVKKLVEKHLSKGTDLTDRIFKDPSRFINYITSQNFDKTISDMEKEQGKELDESFKTELQKLVRSRELVGVAFWYIHTGILTLCITQNYLASYTCKG